MDNIQEMLDSQAKLQRELSTRVKGNVDPSTCDTLGSLYEYLRDNKIALDDEFREIVDALPSSSDPSALWKKWKAKHIELGNVPVTPELLEPAQREFIDLWHLVLNMALALRLSSDDILRLYREKNQENMRRYSNYY